LEQTVVPQPAQEPTDRRRDLLTPSLLAVLAAGAVAFLSGAPSSYEVYLTVHVIAAVVWVGGGTALTIFSLLTLRAHDPRARANLAVQMETIGQRLFMPASLVTLACGIALVEKGGWDWGTFWIDFSLVVWAASFVLGAGVIGPRSGRLRRLVRERGPEDPLVQRGIEQVLLVARVDVTLLLLVVVDMAAKPTF
jgi:uncharacterized membrane protein